MNRTLGLSRVFDLSATPFFLSGSGYAEGTLFPWATLHSAISRPFPMPKSGRIAVKVINHLGDEVMKVFRVE